jgi:hypothetical protein
MKLPSVIQSLKQYEIVIIIIFIIYLVYPLKTPQIVANFIDNILGITVIFLVTLFLFIYTNPILAIIFLFVSYELFRRSSNTTVKTAMLQYVPTQEKIDEKLAIINELKYVSLEEEVVEVRAPIGKSEAILPEQTTYKYVMDNTGGASLYR